MKKLFTIIFALLLASNTFAQSLEILQPLQMIENSSVLAQYKNQFGKHEMPDKDVPFPFALIRVRLEGSGTEVTAAQQVLGLQMGTQIVVADMDRSQTNEILFLVPITAKNIYVTCGNGCKEQLLVSSARLRPNTVYTCKVHYTPEEIVYGPKKPKITSQYLLINVTPSNATIKVNGEIWPTEEGTAMKYVPFGTYFYTIQAKNYYDEEGSIVVNDPENKQTKNISLRPAVGSIKVIGNKNQEGGIVYLDDNQIGNIPMTIEQVSPGEHNIKVVKTMYHVYETTIVVHEGETISVTSQMQPDYAHVTLKADGEAEIWINTQLKGVGSWAGDLASGTYQVETRLNNHHPNTQSIQISPELTGQTITLKAPIPMYGALNVGVTPVGSTIYIDGKKVGETPKMIAQTLCGQHILKVTKSGYIDHSETITINEGQTTTINLALQKNSVANKSLFSHHQKSDDEDKVLLTLDGQSIYASEFIYLYKKNNQEQTNGTTKAFNDYLELFINFKLKVREAEKLGMDTTQAFAQELKGYRNQATPKYFCDSIALDSLIKLSYERMQNDRRAAHIAIACPTDTTEAAKKEALSKINAIRKRALAGANFASLATEASTIPGVKEDKGELGWITPFRYVYAFEDAIYSTPVGQITPVFRSPYGYHIALVEEAIPHEEVHASHIMKMASATDEVAKQKAKSEIYEIYRNPNLRNNFANIAMTNSDDKGSAKKGGDLGWFGRGVMVKPFEDTVFKLKIGGISEPFESKFGWHIAKVDGRRKTLPLDSLYDQIKTKVEKDERYKEVEKSFVSKARSAFKLSTSMSDDEVRQYVDDHLEENFPEFKQLMQEYRDGILLFDVSLSKVWDKATKDEKGLTNYFNTHKKEYTWSEPRWRGYMIYAKDQSTANVAAAIVKSANPDSIQSYIKQRINADKERVKVEYGIWERGQNKAVDKYGFKVNNGYFNSSMPIVMAVGKTLKQPETYLDVNGQIVSAYQDMLEQQWVQELRQKYSIIINTDVFEEIKEKYEN